MPSKLLLAAAFVALVQPVAFAAFDDFVKKHFPFSFGLCKYPHLNGYFQHEKFFVGTWHVKSSYNSPLQAESSCTTLESQISDSGEITIRNKLTNLKSGTSEIVVGTTYAKYVKFNREIFPVTFQIPTEKNGLEIGFSILDTDYDNWAVVFSCQQHFGYKHEMAWILTRHADVENDDGIASALGVVGLSRKDLTFEENILCQDTSHHNVEL